MFDINGFTFRLATLSLAAVCVCHTGCDLKPDGGRPNPTTGGEAHPEAAKPAEKTVSVKINTMTCVEGCFNGIKTVLEKRPGIQQVTLAPQQNDEGQVDNSVIFIAYNGELDQTEVERLVVGAGFESVEFLDNKASDAPAESSAN